MVQFARGSLDGLDYALKFYISKNAFEVERSLYAHPVLGPLLPKVVTSCKNDDNAECDPSGRPLPPFIVMEKGESLDEWSRRAKPDLFQAVAVRLPLVATLPPSKSLASLCYSINYNHTE
jgi:hypothetical protein